MDNEEGQVETPITALQEVNKPLQNVVVVVMDLSKVPSLSAAEWTLDNHAKTGDLLVLLGVLDNSSCFPMKQRLGVAKNDSVAVNGTNEKILPDEASLKKSEFEKSTSSLQLNCSKKGVMLDIRVKVGALKSIIVDEATALHATLLTFDRNLKLKKPKDRNFIQENMSCRIYQMKNDYEADIIREDEKQMSRGEHFLDESQGADATSTTPERESHCFTSSRKNSGLQVSSVDGLIEDEQSSPNSEIYMTQGNLPRLLSSSELSGLDRLGVYFHDSSSSLGAGNFSVTETSPSESHTTVNYSISRSASDSSFQSHDTHSLLEIATPIPVQHERRRFEVVSVHNRGELGSQYQRNQGKTRNNWNVPLDILSSISDSSRSANYYKKNAAEAMQTSEGRSMLLAESLEHQQQTDLQKVHDQKLNDAPFQHVAPWTLQKTITFTNWSIPSMYFSQGRPLLCSICKQKSPKFGNIPRKFTYAELEEATDNFSQANFLAEGGFGFIYRGTLKGQTIAVKQHKLASTQGYKEFRSEVEVLSCAQHRNLVMLLGCCDENGHRMLVYEFVCNKSLDWHLSKKSPTRLEWAARQKIAVGAARALRYLHEECRVGCIVHRDVRPNNILLTHEFEPMVGDFGLARSHPEGEQAIETCIIGAFGYLAPEYAESGQVSWKSDVYAFGVVLLELISGRKAIDLLRAQGQQSLTEFARPRLVNDGMVLDLIDPRLEGSYNVNQMRSMMHAAYHCIKKDPSARPRMSQVLHILEGENKNVNEIPRQLLDLSSSAIVKGSDFASSPAPSLQSALSQKNQSRQGNKNRGRTKLNYEDML